MNFMQITSRQNDKIKHCAKLINGAKFRRETQTFVVEGIKIVKDLLKSKTEVTQTFISANFKHKNSDLVNELAQNSAEIYVISPDIFAKISDTTTSQEVVCICKMPKLPQNLCPNSKYILCENLQDPANLGSIIRTANALNFGGIITINGADIFSPKTIRATMGAIFNVPIIQFEDAKSAINAMKSANLKSYATVINNGEDLTKTKFGNRGVILIGNEGNGLSDEITALADYKITIQMAISADSLNAAAAATIAMWEFAKGDI